MVLSFAPHYYSFYYSLFNAATLLAIPCLTLLFFYYPLFDIIAPFVILWSMLMFFLLFLGRHCFSTFLGRCCYSFTCSSLTRLTQVPLCYVVMLMFLYSLFDVIVLTPLVLDWYFPHQFFVAMGRTLQIQIFRPNLKGEVFFQYFFVDEFFYYPCFFWEILVNNVFVCYVQKLFGHCTFNYTHFICTIAMCIFLTHCIFF
jgi:hypothetical protein